MLYHQQRGFLGLDFGRSFCPCSKPQVALERARRTRADRGLCTRPKMAVTLTLFSLI